MIFAETPLNGAYIIHMEPRADERGFFARTYCTDEFKANGIDHQIVQGNMSFNPRAGTLRGMHYQIPPAPESKLVRCIRGAIYDVIVDLRPDSPTYMQHFGVELTAENRSAIFIPPLFSHGFQTLLDNTEVNYLVSAVYTPALERGHSYADPALNIHWPLPISIISAKDAALLPFSPSP